MSKFEPTKQCSLYFFVLSVRRNLSPQSNVPSNFLCSLCAEILARAHFLWEFTQSFVFGIQSAFRVRNKVKTKKRGLHPKSSGVRVRKVFCLTYNCNFMLNNSMPEQEYVYAQQIYACAQSLKSCARAHANNLKRTLPLFLKLKNY